MHLSALLLLLSACKGTDAPTDDTSPVTTDDTGDTPDTGDTDVAAYDCGPDQADLRDGITTLDWGGSYLSPFVVHGDQACPVVIDSSGRTLVASSRVDQGWVVAFGHEGLLAGPDAGSGLHTLLSNSLGLGGDTPSVGLAPSVSGLGGWLTDELGASSAVIGVENLDEFDVYVTTVYTEYSASELADLHAYVASGGGLLIGGHGWYYGPNYADPATQYPGNQVLNALGLTVSVQYSNPGAMELDQGTVPTPLHHHAHALSQLAAHVEGTQVLDQDELVTGSATARFAASALPVTFSDWWDIARDFVDRVPPVVPTEATPLVLDEQPVEGLALALETTLALQSPHDEISEASSASDFPGAVSASAPRVSTSLTVDATWAGRDPDFLYSGAHADLWLSTGVYAAPAEAITLTVPQAWVDQGLALQIGAHADGLWSKDELHRAPELVRTDPVDAAQITQASGFGGPVYLRVPVGTELGPGEITIDGAVAMPRFVAGVTDPSDWQALLDAQPTPWAELETEHLILTLPTAELVALGVTDPTQVLEIWAQVMDADADLAGVSRDRPRPERMVLDRQISAGWMHSGYPIMGHLASTAELSDVDTLTTVGAWGPLHELGHNHQLAPLVLPGTTETTCNLFSVYTSELVLGIDRADAHSAVSAASRQERLDDYVAGGADFDADWSVWVALETYLQLQEAFGWAPLITVHQDAYEMARGSRPTTDAARIDAWVVATSLATERDLRGFYAAWGFPYSADVDGQVEHLAPWTDHPLAD